MNASNLVRRVTLDGTLMTTIPETHAYLKKKFDFPEYYGRNLDALWDFLSTYSESLLITLEQSESLYSFLGVYAVELVRLFSEVQEANPNIVFVSDVQKL